MDLRNGRPFPAALLPLRPGKLLKADANGVGRTSLSRLAFDFGKETSMRGQPPSAVRRAQRSVDKWSLAFRPASESEQRRNLLSPETVWEALAILAVQQIAHRLPPSLDRQRGGGGDRLN